eukprot:ANDGO_03958.mRNA.1 SAC/GANP domain-containing protein
MNRQGLREGVSPDSKQIRLSKLPPELLSKPALLSFLSPLGKVESIDYVVQGMQQETVAFVRFSTHEEALHALIAARTWQSQNVITTAWARSRNPNQARPQQPTADVVNPESAVQRFHQNDLSAPQFLIGSQAGFAGPQPHYGWGQPQGMTHSEQHLAGLSSGAYDMAEDMSMGITWEGGRRQREKNEPRRDRNRTASQDGAADPASMGLETGSQSHAWASAIGGTVFGSSVPGAPSLPSATFPSAASHSEFPIGRTFQSGQLLESSRQDLRRGASPASAPPPSGQTLAPASTSASAAVWTPGFANNSAASESQQIDKWKSRRTQISDAAVAAAQAQAQVQARASPFVTGGEQLQPPRERKGRVPGDLQSKSGRNMTPPPFLPQNPATANARLVSLPTDVFGSSNGAGHLENISSSSDDYPVVDWKSLAKSLREAGVEVVSSDMPHSNASCQSMCSRAEIDRRREKQDIRRFESDPNVGYVRKVGWKLDLNRMVKAYVRSAAAAQKDPSDTRPPLVILKTLQHLVSVFLTNYEADYFPSLVEFITGSVRACLVDITVQRANSAVSRLALRIASRLILVVLSRCPAIESQGLSPKQVRDLLTQICASLEEQQDGVPDFDSESSMLYSMLELYKSERFFAVRVQSTFRKLDERYRMLSRSLSAAIFSGNPHSLKSVVSSSPIAIQLIFRCILPKLQRIVSGPVLFGLRNPTAPNDDAISEDYAAEICFVDPKDVKDLSRKTLIDVLTRDADSGLLPDPLPVPDSHWFFRGLDGTAVGSPVPSVSYSQQDVVQEESQPENASAPSASMHLEIAQKTKEAAQEAHRLKQIEELKRRIKENEDRIQAAEHERHRVAEEARAAEAARLLERQKEMQEAAKRRLERERQEELERARQLALRKKNEYIAYREVHNRRKCLHNAWSRWLSELEHLSDSRVPNVVSKAESQHESTSPEAESEPFSLFEGEMNAFTDSILGAYGLRGNWRVGVDVCFVGESCPEATFCDCEKSLDACLQLVSFSLDHVSQIQWKRVPFYSDVSLPTALFAFFEQVEDQMMDSKGSLVLSACRLLRKLASMEEIVSRSPGVLFERVCMALVTEWENRGSDLDCLMSIPELTSSLSLGYSQQRRRLFSYFLHSACEQLSCFSVRISVPISLVSSVLAFKNGFEEVVLHVVSRLCDHLGPVMSTITPAQVVVIRDQGPSAFQLSFMLASSVPSEDHGRKRELPLQDTFDPEVSQLLKKKIKITPDLLNRDFDEHLRSQEDIMQHLQAERSAWKDIQWMVGVADATLKREVYGSLLSYEDEEFIRDFLSR